MPERDLSVRPGRENRLLVITIAVSVAMLLLLSRFRFPAQDRQQAALAVPLDRLAARATFDELATIISRLQDRIAPALVVLRVSAPDGEAGGSSAPAPATRQRYVVGMRMPNDLAIVHLPPDARVEAIVGAMDFVPAIVAADRLREIALIRVPAAPDAPVLAWNQDPWLTAPAYIVAVEGTRGGPALRPIFLGRTDLVTVERWDRPLLMLGGTQQAPAGAPLVSLEGTFLGMTVLDEGYLGVAAAPLIAIEAERLRTVGSPPSSDIGIDVSALTASIARASGAERGAVVTYVHPRGPADGRLKVGDVIERVADQAIASPETAVVRIARTPPGTILTMGIVRKGRRQSVDVTTANAAPPAQTSSPAPSDTGMILRNARGVGSEVLRVSPNSAAARAGIVAGDVVTHLDGSPAPTASEIARAFGRSKAVALLLGVRRGQTHLVLALERP